MKVGGFFLPVAMVVAWEQDAYNGPRLFVSFLNFAMITGAP
jgi:hypothetical protein